MALFARRCDECSQTPCMGGGGPGSCQGGGSAKKAKKLSEDEAGLPEPRIKGGLTKGTRLIVAPGVGKEAAEAWIKKAHVPQKGHYEWNEKTHDLEYVVDRD